MPYEISKMGDRFCVVKKDGGKKMGCHKTRAEAVDQIQAIYANEAMQAIVDSFNTEEEELCGELDEFGNCLDDEKEVIVAAFQLTERKWSGPIVFEGQATGDNREFNAEAISWDQLPLPLLFQRVSGEGHSGSVVIGRVDEMERDGSSIMAKGVILEGIPEADEFVALMEHGAAGGVSVDGDSAQYAVEEGEDGGKPTVKFTSMRIRGLTAVAIPAFSDAQIELDEEVEELAKRRKRKRKTKRAYSWKLAQEQGITAAAAPVKPPIEWFQDPQLSEPTALTVTPDGFVYGHIGLFGTCHIGMPGCTKPPRGGTYAYFHTGELETEDGTAVAVGHLTFNTGHASVYDKAAAAAAHYDNTGTVGADVVAGEDAHGIWVAGALRPELSEEQVRTFRAAPISGDWRRISNKMELVAALSVNTPGFPVPRNKALVASATMEQETVITFADSEEITDMKDRQEFRDILSSRVRTIFGMESPEEIASRNQQRADLLNKVNSFFSNESEETETETETFDAETEEFNLGKLKSALEDVDDVIDALDQDTPNVSSALSNAKSAKDKLEKAVDDYSGGYRRGVRVPIIVSPKPGNGNGGNGNGNGDNGNGGMTMAADTEEFCPEGMKDSALKHLDLAKESADDETLAHIEEAYDALTDMEHEEDEDYEMSALLDSFSVEELEEIHEFYNQCHDPETGIFCEGPDGPGRLADNMKKAEAVIGKKAPQYMKNLISRRLNKQTKEAGLPKNAPKYMKDLLSKRVSEAVGKNVKTEDLPIGEYKRSSRGRRPKG